jgi:hypothetical protein
VSRLNHSVNKLVIHLSIVTQLLFLSNISHAGSLQASYGQLEQEVTIQETSIITKPEGGVLSLSFDLNDKWNLSVDYQEWQDDQTVTPTNNSTATPATQLPFPAQVNLDLQTWGTGISYYHEAWSFSSQFSVSNDDTAIYKGARSKDFREEHLKSTSLSGSVAYSWSVVNWLYNASLAAQYSDWDLQAQQVTPAKKKENRPLEQSTSLDEFSSGDSSTINASLSMARYWSLNQNQGMLVGALVAWNYLLSGESSMVTRNGKNLPPPPANNVNAPRFNNRIPSLSSAGDDNSGQLSLYFSYDISEQWSVDIDIARGIGSDFNGQSWSLGGSYSF